MTNAEIIFWNSVELMNQGLIGTTGKKLVVAMPDGEERELMEPEPIHTFACWKNLGYSVKKGEHAVAKIQIWKGSERVVKDEDGNDTDETTVRMFKKVAFFFTAAQVEPTVDRKTGQKPRRRRAVEKPPVIPDLPIVAPDPESGYGSWLN